jgi:peptidoglycan hydrolase-like protein with peptidoglycan-binding domain
MTAVAFANFASATTTTGKHSHSSTVKPSSKSEKASAHSSKTSSHSRKARSRRGKYVAKKSWKSKGQHGISTDRAREIQEALIRQHYLDGEPNGTWDSRTQEACRRYQADNGWQTKVLPDSRLLIKLGLGPDHSNVLNPETAATSPYLPGGGEKSSNAIAPATASVPQQ